MCLVVLFCGLSCRSMSSRPERFSRSDCRGSLDRQDKILKELVELASQDLVSTIVVPQLREASKTKTYHSLVVYVDIFDRAATGAAERSIDFLYRCARQCLAHIDRETMRTSLTKVSTVAPVRPGGECSDENALLCLDPW